VCAQGTLVGLLAAFSYELSILHAASRLTSADAFRTLHALYRERTHTLHPAGALGESGSSHAASSSNGGAAAACQPPLHLSCYSNSQDAIVAQCFLGHGVWQGIW
jgi:hypothetical protein